MFFLLYSYVVGSNKVVAVSSEVLEVPTTNKRRVEEKTTISTRSKVVATSTRITRSKMVARSTRIKKKPYALEMIEWETSRIYETL
jgi:predicted house-cleaning NTP pyrophosphatase (Maf/HAM1 superfamily)